MRTTGITRRIDELGRVVIPKEIRRTMRLREGEEMEIFVEENGIVFKKFSSVQHFKIFADEIADNLSKITDGTVLVCDNDNVVAAAGNKYREYVVKPIMRHIANAFNERKTIVLNDTEALAVTGEDTNVYPFEIIAPIISSGDVVGGIVYLADSPDGVLTKTKLVELAAGVLGDILK